MSLVEQKLGTCPKLLCSSLVLSGIGVAPSFVFVCSVFFLFSRSFLSGYCIVCRSLIYGVLLHLWFLQAFLDWLRWISGNIFNNKNTLYIIRYNWVFLHQLWIISQIYFGQIIHCTKASYVRLGFQDSMSN